MNEPKISVTFNFGTKPPGLDVKAVFKEALDNQDHVSVKQYLPDDLTANYNNPFIYRFIKEQGLAGLLRVDVDLYKDGGFRQKAIYQASLICYDDQGVICGSVDSVDYCFSDEEELSNAIKSGVRTAGENKGVNTFNCCMKHFCDVVAKN